VRVVRDRGDARWLPSRFNFALFRLIAYFRLRTAKPETTPGVVMAVHRHQTAAEAYLASVCVFLVIASFIASLLASSMPFGAACIVAIPTSAIVIPPMVVAVGIVARLARKTINLSSDHNIAVSSVMLMAIIIAAATLLAAGESPLRHVGTAFLLLVGANAVAAVAVFMMERPIADAERRFGAGT
jgi:hypothetical protein